MQKLLFAIVIFFGVSAASVSIFFGKHNNKPVVLISPVADPLPETPINQASVSGITSLVATESSVASITANISPIPRKLSPAPKPTAVPTPASSQEVNELIDRFSVQYGVNPNVLRHMILCESGFNSSAVNHIYVGLFQFDTSTWINFRKQIGEDPDPKLRFSAKDSVQTGTYAISKGKGNLWPNCYPK